jgi:hemerythrin superfamily protein
VGKRFTSLLRYGQEKYFMAATKAKSILSLIESDHRRVEKLFQEMEPSKSGKAIECFNQIYVELTLHAKAEEIVFYPALQDYEDAKQYIEEAESEHNAAKILLEQMKMLNPAEDEFQTKLTHLKEAVAHHVEEEEQEIFEIVREYIEEEKLQQLGQEFQSAKSRLEADVELALTR